METENISATTESKLRGDALLAYGCEHGCRVRVGENRQPADLIAIGRQWARIRVPSAGAELAPGLAVSLEPGLKAGLDLPRDISGRIAGRAGNELWVSFSAPLEVPLMDLQSSLETCATA